MYYFYSLTLYAVELFLKYFGAVSYSSCIVNSTFIVLDAILHITNFFAVVLFFFWQVGQWWLYKCFVTAFWLVFGNNHLQSTRSVCCLHCPEQDFCLAAIK